MSDLVIGIKKYHLNHSLDTEKQSVWIQIIFCNSFEMKEQKHLLSLMKMTSVSFSMFGFVIGIWAKSFEQLQLIPLLVITPLLGVPNEEMGEEVKAVVQPADGVAADADLEAELIAYCRANLAAYKCPRSVDFDPELPRDPNGKLYKRIVRERYWAGRDSRVL